MEAVFSHIVTKGVNLKRSCFLFKGQLEHVQLSAPSVVVKNKAVNLTTVLRPSNVGTVTYYWWFNNKTEVSLTFSFLSHSYHAACLLNGVIDSQVTNSHLMLFIYKALLPKYLTSLLSFKSSNYLTLDIPHVRTNVDRTGFRYAPFRFLIILFQGNLLPQSIKSLAYIYIYINTLYTTT